MCEDIYFKHIRKINDLYKNDELNLYLQDSSPKKEIDKKLPIFSYGFLKAIQIALELYLESDKVASVQDYGLYIKDGLPVALKENGSDIHGRILKFIPEKSELAYRNIAILTIGGIYAWQEVKDIHGNKMNMLVLSKDVIENDQNLISLIKVESGMWNIKDDTAFLDIMYFLESKYFNQILNPHRSNKMFRSLKDESIALQMAYMQLWSVIERYCSMHYWVDKRRVTAKIRMFAETDEYFISAVEKYSDDFLSQRNQKVYHSYNGGYVDFSKGNIIDYYYAIRCNVVHRGKETTLRDVNILKYAFLELFSIMYAVINHNFSLIDIVKNYK